MAFTKFKPHWEEFEINSEGKFMIPHESMDYVACLYPWWNWAGFLSDNNDKYNNFGGWLYELPKLDTKEKQIWVTAPRIMVGEYPYTWTERYEDCKPIIPKKIRFWRHKE